jgi:ArsR family transcriptional regulator
VDQMEVMADQFKMLSDKSRLSILALLNEKEEMCVCELVEILDMSQPNVSQHLRKLKAAGMVSEYRKGQWVYYSLHFDGKPYLTEIMKYVPSLKEKLLEARAKC